MQPSEKLQETLLLLAHWSKCAKEEEGIISTLVAVTQLPSGVGVVNVYENGELKERPMEIMMAAQEVCSKARLFAHKMIGTGIKPVSL